MLAPGGEALGLQEHAFTYVDRCSTLPRVQDRHISTCSSLWASGNGWLQDMVGGGETSPGTALDCRTPAWGWCEGCAASNMLLHLQKAVERSLKLTGLTGNTY